jgi:signal transduction histidine kinase
MRRAAIVGELTGGVLHDFNNVLTVITGMIDILADAVADEPQLAAVARLIDQAAARGAALTARLLSFARGQPSEPCEVELTALVGDAVRLLRPTLGGIELAIEAADDLPPALADPGQLMAAMLSIAIVARDSMPEGGKLTFRAVAVRAEDRLAHVRASEADDALAIHIAAHGYGSVADHPERIFIDADVARDFIGSSGGQLVIGAPSGADAQLWIVLRKAAPAQSWLADG